MRLLRFQIAIWFTNEPDLAVWKRVRQAFAPKDVRIYQHIILETRQAWQFISGPLKVKVISYWAKEHEINVKMLAEGRLAHTEWWVDDKDYSSTKRSEDESTGFPPHRVIEAAQSTLTHLPRQIAESSALADEMNAE